MNLVKTGIDIAYIERSGIVIEWRTYDGKKITKGDVSMEFAKRFLPAIKMKRPNITFEREKFAFFFETYWIQTIIVSCLSSVALALPAYIIKFAHMEGIFSFYLLAIFLSLPWFLVPILFVLYYVKDPHQAKRAAFITSGVLLLTFILWIIALFQL